MALIVQYLRKKPVEFSDERRLLSLFTGEGVWSNGDFLITNPNTDPITLQFAAGSCFVSELDNVAGMYHVYSGSAEQISINDGDGTNPRIDQVVVEVLDSEVSGSSDLARIRAVIGTPTGGATLDNRSGVAALDAKTLLLYDVLVPNGAVSGSSLSIRDRRKMWADGAVPPLTTDVTMVEMEFSPAIRTLPADNSINPLQISHATHDLDQAAALCYLPQRIKQATRIRWKYVQDGTTALTGNWRIGIYDCSGRKIVETGSTAFAGGTSSVQVVSATITATDFDRGLYYVVIGLDTGAGIAYVTGARPRVAASVPGPAIPNVAFRADTGGVTLPTTILSGFTDLGTAAAATECPTIPAISLSVG